MPSLYHLTRELLDLLDETDHAEIDDAQWLDRVAEHLGRKIETKVDNIARMRVEMRAKEDALKGEIDRLTARRRSVAAARKRLEDYAVASILELVAPDAKGRRRVETSSFVTRIQRNPPGVDLDHTKVEELPEEFVEVTRKPKSRDLIDHFRSTGEIVPGMALKPESYSLRVQ